MRLAVWLPLILMLILAVPAVADVEPAGYGYNVTINSTPLWFTFEYASAYTITTYNITPYADFTDNNSWMVLGTNDGITFNPIDERINITLLEGTNYTFTIMAPGSYKFYDVFLFTGFTPPDEKIEVHMYAEGVEPEPVYIFSYGAPPQVAEPVLPAITIVGLVAGAILRRRKP
jgi:hypothetical protein